MRDIQCKVEDFNKKLLGTSTIQFTGVNLLKKLLTRPTIMPEYEILGAPVSPEEIKSAMFSIPGNKSPGPDGYNSFFFKKIWEITGDLVTAATTGKKLKQSNTTIITLIPKIPNAPKMSEYRPISCCNTIYKCLYEVLSLRIKQVFLHASGYFVFCANR